MRRKRIGFALWLSAFAVVAGCTGASSESGVASGSDSAAPGPSDVPDGALSTTDDAGVAAYDATADGGDSDAGARCTSSPLGYAAEAVVPHPGHSENVPPPYAGRLNPFAQVADVVAAGAALYKPHCVSCHGDTGRGDGPDWNKYHPRPAALIALVDHSDANLLWRISESGFMPPLCSAMPGYKNELTEDERWRLIAFLRTLGDVPPFELDAGATPLPPSMSYLTVVGTALHVAWSAQSACDRIDVLRSENGAASKALISLVGNASTHNDTSVAKDGTYCYRAQCVSGGKVSAPSEAMCGSVAMPDGGTDMDAMPAP